MYNLQQEVKGVNLINKVTKEIIEHLIPQLQPYVGKQIFTLSGESKKFKYQFKKLDISKEGGTIDNTHLQSTISSLWLNVSISMMVSEHTCNYWKKEIYLGKLENGVLQELKSVEQTLKEYNLGTPLIYEAVWETILKIRNLKEEITKLQNNLGVDKYFIDNNVKY